MKTSLSILAGASLSVAAYAHWPMPSLPASAHADAIIVYKSERTLVLLSGGKVLKRYSIALGAHPVGAKAEEGDGKTPEGSYIIDYRKPGSAFHLALHISYPNAQDHSAAVKRGVSAGDLIMIHGLRNGLGFLGRLHRIADWTNGCIAVTNAEIEEISRVVVERIPVEIRA